MATKQFYATGDFKYGTRMLRAGDPVQLDGPSARLFAALGKITPARPRVAKAEAATIDVEAVPVAGKTPRKRRKAKA